MGVWLGPQKRLPFFEISGTEDTDYYYAERVINGVRYWEIAILNNQTISFKKDIQVDIFLVGHGESGGTYNGIWDDKQHNNSTVTGCAGGVGGKWYNDSITLIKNTDYIVTFNSSNTIFTDNNLEYTTQNGNSGKPGGTAGISYYSGASFQAPSNGTQGIYAYNDSTNNLLIPATKITFQRFCAGGGAGNVFRYSGSSYTYCDTGSTAGGIDSGGDGGTQNNNTPSEGKPHSGSGGGGGLVGVNTYAGGYSQLINAKSSSAAGGSGIVLIRAHRNLAKASS